MKGMPEELRLKIQKYVEENPPKIYWDYRDVIDDTALEKVLSMNDPMDALREEIWELNQEYIFELEKNCLDNIIEDFGAEIMEKMGCSEEELTEIIEGSVVPPVSLNIEELLCQQRDPVCLIKVYSNLDCAISTNKITDKDCYLGSVYQRVKRGCLEKEYLSEFANAYTASLLCFAFKMPLEDFLVLKRDFNESKENLVFIPKGTNYGFFSSFNGSGSSFTAETIHDLKLPIVEPGEDHGGYDCLGLIADLEQSYSMAEVYGGIEVNYAEIKIIQK